MKICVVILLYLALFSSLIAQDKDYPVATPTDQPDVVISPYDSTRRLDVAGMKVGSLAEDPIAKKIFRIPFSNPTSRYFEEFGDKNSQTPPPPITKNSSGVIPPPPIDKKSSQPKSSVTQPTGPNSPSWIPASSPMPTDLLNFIYAFNQNSTVNDPDALGPFYADTVENYFGSRNVTKATIRSDRASYINRYPQREYILDGPPVLLGQNGDYFEVMTRIRYVVGGNGRNRSGVVSDYFKIRRGAIRYEIVSISEARAAAAPDVIQEEDTRRIETQSPISTHASEGTVYSRFEVDQISLFLDAFAASGEVNEPSATVDFMHPQISTYYSKSNPLMSDLLEERNVYIKQWPERRYWLTEKPVISPLSSGSWDVVLKTGFEVKNGSKTNSGVTVSELRLTHTPAGLKISSIKSRN